MLGGLVGCPLDESITCQQTGEIVGVAHVNNKLYVYTTTSITNISIAEIICAAEKD